MQMRMQRKMKKSRRAPSLTKKVRMPKRTRKRRTRPPRGSRRQAHHPWLARLMRRLLLATMTRRIKMRLPPRLAPNPHLPQRSFPCPSMPSPSPNLPLPIVSPHPQRTGFIDAGSWFLDGALCVGLCVSMCVLCSCILHRFVVSRLEYSKLEQKKRVMSVCAVCDALDPC